MNRRHLANAWRRLVRRRRDEGSPSTACRSSTATQMYRCIVWGGYGWGNVGDELTLAVAIEDMKRRFGDSVAILTRAPGYTRRLFPDCAIIPFEPIKRADGFGDPISFFDVEEQLRSTDWATQLAACELVYLVGGGYLSDLFWLDWLLLPVFVALEGGAKIATAPLGIGPFQCDAWARRVVEALRSADIAVRDDASLAICRQLGLPAIRRDDDGFRLSEVLPPAASHPSCKPRPWRIGVNSFFQHGSARHNDSNAWWADLIRQLSRENTVIEGFCFHNVITDDLAVTSECLARAGLDPCLAKTPDFDFRTACARLEGFDAIVSSRFHAIVVGNALGRHTFAVCDGDYYCWKMEAATTKFKHSTLVRQFDSSPKKVAANILQALQSSSPRTAAA